MKQRVLVFDDDESYGKILAVQGRKMNLDVTYCTEMNDFCVKALEGNFDLALIDYNLSENFKGDLVAKVIENKPTLIMSSDDRLANPEKSWPRGVLGFIKKSDSPQSVFSQALQRLAETPEVL